MKNLLFLSLFLFVATAMNAQVFVNKVNINQQNVKYVEVWEKQDQGKSTVFGLVDYGQHDDRKNDKHGKMLRISNADGVALEFNSSMHILNFLNANGWEVMHVKAVDSYESYIMKRTSMEMQISGSDN